MDTTQHLRIFQQFSEVHRAVDALQAFVAENAVEEPSFLRLRQALVEWLNNVIEHGQQDAHIDIEFMLNDERFSAIVRDHNPALPEGFILTPRVAPDPTELPEGGWGMLIIQAMVDQLSLQSHDGGNTMQLSILFCCDESRVQTDTSSANKQRTA